MRSNALIFVSEIDHVWSILKLHPSISLWDSHGNPCGITCPIQLDGKPFDAFTIQSMRATYQQFGQDVEDFSQPIPAGATVTGYIGAEVYEDYQEGVLLYSPLAGGSGDNQDDSKLISYTFHPDDLLDIESAPMQTAMPTESNS